MRMTILSIVAAAMLAGCGKEPAEEIKPAPQPAVAVASPEASPGPTCGYGKGFDALPPGVCLSSVYRFRDAREYVDDKGRDRRRLTFNFIDNGALAVSEHVSNEFAKTGYKIRPRTENRDGALQVPMTRKDLGTVYLSVKPNASNPDGGGSFFIDFLQNPIQPVDTGGA